MQFSFTEKLAVLWSIFTMIYFTAVTFLPLSPGGQRIADTILGVLIASITGVIINYYYGSSKKRPPEVEKDVP